ncbi:MAG: D-glycero-alpha-D-manno-heptose-1,7-bisphosphate 7-phosphatase [Caldicoprobacterales bacterium]|jgi:D-glycero-D-manno-heptose 1,7-bisphosphate phosphatase|nr:HAD-IIIA family hydrolase [Clostridiales bacterium]
MSYRKCKAVFFDRDGIINERLSGDRVVTTWKEFRFIPDVFRILRFIKSRGYLTILTTNQSAIAGRLMTEQQLLEIHDQMQYVLELNDCPFDHIFYCPHDIQDGCSCRKPSPGLLMTAELYHPIDKANSYMVGHSDEDMEAGRSYGIKTIRVGKWDAAADYSVANLDDILHIII